MDIEYEATFPNINKDDIRSKLQKAGAKLVRPEFLQKRIPFDPPSGVLSKDSWLRVRDEGDKTTLSLKTIDGDKIEDQKELCLEVDDFDKAVELLEDVGCKKKSYQETKRELWKLDGVDITIDEWPFLEPFVEVEGGSEQAVKQVSEKIGFDYKKALFCGVTPLYCTKYGVSTNKVNSEKRIVFDMDNPFLMKN